MKKTTIWLSALLLCLALIMPMQANAAEVTASGTCGDNLTWTLTEDGTLTISGEGAMWDFFVDDPWSDIPWYDYRDCVLAVNIGDGVTSIGTYAFHCTDITSVTVPDSVTSIGDDAFSGCTALTSVILGNGVTCIGSMAFSYCTALTDLTINSDIENIGYEIFYNCSIKNLTIGSNVTKIPSMFYGLTITVSSENQHYSSQGGVLYNKDKSTLIRCSSAFEGSLTIPDSVTTISEGAFHYCCSLTSVTIPDSVTTIGNYAFYECDALTNVTIGSSVTSIGNGAFLGCGLINLVIPDSVTSIGYEAFYACSGMTSLVIGSGVTIIRNCAFLGCENLTSITIPDSVTTIEDSAFSGCSSLTSVTIPDSVTSIGGGAFSGCCALTSVTIGSGVMSISNEAFSSCEALTSITVSNDNQTYCSRDGVLFSKDMTRLIRYPIGNARTSYSIPNGVTSIVGGAFSGSGLTSITIPTSMTSISCDAFAGCGITSITIPDSVTTIDEWAFACCGALTSITIPDSVTSIGNCAFIYCDNLSTVYYTGTAEQWAEITIGEENINLFYANRIFDWQPNPPASKVPIVTVTLNDKNQVVITWTAVEGALKYELYRAVGNVEFKLLTTTTGTKITNTSVKPGVTYSYAVRVIADSDPGNFSAIKTITTPDELILTAPTVTATIIASTGKIKLSWNAVEGAEKYEIWACTTKNGSYSKLGAVTGTSVTHSSAKAGKTYYYKVRAVAGDANSAASVAVGKTCDCARPTLTVKLNSKGKPALSWNAVEGAVKYEIYASTSKDGTYTKLGTVTGTSVAHSSAKSGVTYYYKVKAICSVSRGDSAFSAIKSVTVG